LCRAKDLILACEQLIAFYPDGPTICLFLVIDDFDAAICQEMNDLHPFACCQSAGARHGDDVISRKIAPTKLGQSLNNDGSPLYAQEVLGDFAPSIVLSIPQNNSPIAYRRFAREHDKLTGFSTRSFHRDSQI
jgi:hypothetical protein